MRLPTDITDVYGQGNTVAIEFGDYIVPTGNKNEYDAIDKEYFESKYELAEGCEHCQSKIPINQTANADFFIYLDGQDEDNPHLDIEMDDGSWFADCPINFCPKCGAKLREDNE